MALVFMAMLFMLEERILQKKNNDSHCLSCSDIESLLRSFLPPHGMCSRDEVLRQMEKRQPINDKAAIRISQ